MDLNSLRVAQVGYGEVGRIFAAALAAQGSRAVAAFDVRIAEPAWAADARSLIDASTPGRKRKAD